MTLETSGSRRAPLSLVLLLAASVAAAATASHPELGRPWIDSWAAGEYRSRSHQNWDLQLDGTGLVWAGNSGGVQYYDGARWQLLRTPHATIVYATVPHADGRVYLGTTSDLGYFAADGAGSWRYTSLLEGRTDVPPFGNVYDIAETPDGLFFFTRPLLFRFVPATGELTWVEAEHRFLRLAAAGGRLYAADRDVGIFRFDPERGELVEEVPWGDLGAGLSTLGGAADGRLLVVTREGLFALEDGTLRRLPTAVDDWIAESRPYRLRTLPDGGLILTSRLDGLVLLEPDGRLRRRLSRESGLRWPWVTDARVDRQGGLWTTHEGGISRLEIDPTLTFFDEPLGVHSVEAVTRHRGHLIAATTVGLRRLEPPSEPGGQARFVPLDDQGLQTWSLLDVGDQLLVGDTPGVVALDLSSDGSSTGERVLESQRAVHLSPSPLEPDVVWVALENGVARLRRDGGRWRSEGRLRGFDLPVVFVEQAGDGALWLGTITGTYHRVRSVADWPDADLETFRAESGVPAGNAHLFRAGDEVLFGTFDGFRQFTGERFAVDPRFPTELTGGSHNIHRLAEGPDGRLWIHAAGESGVATPTGDGSWTWDREMLRGLPRENVSALHVDDDGVVWLGTRSGLARFDPATWRRPEPLPAARVHRVTIPGQPEPLFGGAGPAEDFPASPLEPPQRALRFEFAVADFAPPHGVEYRTRLDGVDTAWTEWSEETQRDFTSLPAGRRTFRVEARNRRGQVAPEGRFVVRRRPPWYLSAFATLGYGVLALVTIAGSAAGVARRRTARLEAERHRLEALVDERTAEIRRQKDRLAAEHEAKSRFFANVSHELRTPLTLTLGPLEDVASGRRGPLPEPVATSVGTALTHATQLRNLVDQVLDVGRLEAGRMPMAAAEQDLGTFVAAVAARFAAAAERAGVELAWNVDGPELPVWFDPAHLDRVVSNLLANALKFTPEGGRVEISVGRRDDRAEVTVRDTGIGIAAEDLPRVFERYFQARGATGPEPGTGIGLALVRELVALHDGEVTAASTPGEGSAFRVRLPLGRDHLGVGQLAREREPAADPAPLAAPAASPAARLRGEAGDDRSAAETGAVDAPLLLIVDDNAELRGFLRQRFVGRYRVVEASDGSEALDRCRETTPDLVIADVMMPGTDGLELARRLKADPDLDFVPLLLLTARAASEDAVRGLSAGADDYLRKPFDGAELEARVERLIASRRRLRARFAAPEDATGISAAEAEFDRRLQAAIAEQLEAGEASVQALADRLAMDRSNLYRRVQALHGTSPQALILKIRLQTAARMLARGEGSVSEVAYSVGFNSLSHFSDSFRRYFGLPPSRWRREAADALG